MKTSSSQGVDLLLLQVPHKGIASAELLSPLLGIFISRAHHMRPGRQAGDSEMLDVGIEIEGLVENRGDGFVEVLRRGGRDEALDGPAEVVVRVDRSGKRAHAGSLVRVGAHEEGHSGELALGHHVGAEVGEDGAVEDGDPALLEGLGDGGVELLEVGGAEAVERGGGVD